MQRARFAGSAPYLWALAALLATIAVCNERPDPPKTPASRPLSGEPEFFELPPLPPPPIRDAGIVREPGR